MQQPSWNGGAVYVMFEFAENYLEFLREMGAEFLEILGQVFESVLDEVFGGWDGGA